MQQAVARMSSIIVSRAIVILLVIVLILVGLAACVKKSSGSGDAADLSSRKVRVVTTIGMIADVVRNIGGERVEVTSLMGSGVDPHLYKASEGDVGRMSKADVILFNGLHLEAKMGEVLEKLGSQRVSVAVAESIEASKLLSPDEYEGAHDPHVWFDVTLWLKVVEKTRDVLIEADASSAELYRTNTASYITKLQELDRYVKAQAERIPASARVLITAHDAFNYFGNAYGFEVRGLQGISTVSETGAKDVQELSTFIADRKIPAVFVESSVPRRNIEALQAAVRAKGFEVEIGGELFSDAMGSPGTPEGTYIGMVRHNIDTIVEALSR
jgi:manganese/zinc/iron transport system substrate-binding protein